MKLDRDKFLAAVVLLQAATATGCSRTSSSESISSDRSDAVLPGTMTGTAAATANAVLVPNNVAAPANERGWAPPAGERGWVPPAGERGWAPANEAGYVAPANEAGMPAARQAALLPGQPAPTVAPVAPGTPVVGAPVVGNGRPAAILQRNAPVGAPVNGRAPIIRR